MGVDENGVVFMLEISWPPRRPRSTSKCTSWEKLHPQFLILKKKKQMNFWYKKSSFKPDFHRFGRLVVAMVLPMSSSSEDLLGLVEMGDEIMLFFLN